MGTSQSVGTGAEEGAELARVLEDLAMPRLTQAARDGLARLS